MSPALPLLSTKLMLPPLAGGVVPRGRLFARLNEDRPLTILSAPPGFGKTTLLSAWLRQLTKTADHTPPASSWLSLDEDDNDPVRFWSYVITALQTSAVLETDAPDLGVSALAALQSSPTPNVATVITLLINDLAAQSTARVLVLDDSTSAIDSATEDKIQRAISNAARGRTTFIITHRLSQIRWADLIIVFRKGKIAAIGTHDELMKTSEAYSRIFKE